MTCRCGAGHGDASAGWFDDAGVDVAHDLGQRRVCVGASGRCGDRGHVEPGDGPASISAPPTVQESRFLRLQGRAPAYFVVIEGGATAAVRRTAVLVDPERVLPGMSRMRNWFGTGGQSSSWSVVGSGPSWVRRSRLSSRRPPFARNSAAAWRSPEADNRQPTGGRSSAISGQIGYLSALPRFRRKNRALLSASNFGTWLCLPG
jgi:hypothetical protein